MSQAHVNPTTTGPVEVAPAIAAERVMVYRLTATNRDTAIGRLDTFDGTTLIASYELAASGGQITLGGGDAQNPVYPRNAHSKNKAFQVALGGNGDMLVDVVYGYMNGN